MTTENQFAESCPTPATGQASDRRTCENCGLAAWAVREKGIYVTIEDKQEGRFYTRTRRRTVWCHNDECAIQCLGISRYGLATSKWPITLAQFRVTRPLEPFRKPTQPRVTKRVRASRKAKELVWAAQKAMPTAISSLKSNLESIT
jgi:hypothetical protein